MDLVTENHCRNSYERLLLGQPQIRTGGMWRTEQGFFIVCPDLKIARAHDGTPIEHWFSGVKIVGAPVKLVEAVPDGATRVAMRTAADLASGRGGGVTLRDSVADLALLLPPTFPPFGLSDVGPRTTFTIKVPRALSVEEEDALRTAYEALAISETYRVEIIPKIEDSRGFPRWRSGGDLDLVPSKFLPRAFTPSVRWLAEADEERWLKDRADLFGNPERRAGTYLPESYGKKASRCLIDASSFPPPNIRSLLPIYRETLIAMPFADAYQGALASFSVTERDLLRLAEAGRVRFVLPQSLDRYPPSLLNALAERSPDALLLSRTLAAATVAETRRRVPLLFPPLGVEERHQFLSQLHASAINPGRTDPLTLAVLEGLRDAWELCEVSVARRGACGVSWVGAVRMIAAMVKAISGRDLSLELGHAVSYVEWAAALGATVFPVRSEGFSEQRHAELCASMYSGVKDVPVPVNFGAVDVVLSDLLGIANDAPIDDLVSAFSGPDVDRLRDLVTSMAEKNLDPEFLSEAIAAFNDRVRKYEKRREKQVSHDLVALAGALSGPVALATHHPVLGFTSLGGWILNQLFKHLPGGRVTDWIRGANAWSSPDVVLVSRLRQNR